MDINKFHFEIPIKNIRNEKYEKHGGGKTVKRINHSEHGLKLRFQTNELINTISTKKDYNITNDIYFQIETPQSFSIKSQKQTIEKLGLEIISYSAVDETVGVAKIRKDILPKFEEQLNTYIESINNKGKSSFSPINNIVTIPIENKIKIEINSESEIDIIINLYNELNIDAKQKVSDIILDDLKLSASNLTYKTFANGVASIECRIKGKYLNQIVSDYSSINEIKANPTFFVKASLPAEKTPTNLIINPVESDSKICIIDSGINTNNNIFDKIVKEKVAYLPIGSVDCTYGHGTFVASRCVFGDDIDNCLTNNYLSPYCYLIDIAVFGRDSQGIELNPNEFHLRNVIEEVVIKNYHTIQVYNLSLGFPNSIADYNFSELAKLMDFLSKRYKVLFVVAAGNINDILGQFPHEHFKNFSSRIGCPAESLLSLTVGSIAKFSNQDSLVNNNFHSPFSRIGPGADKGIKPEVVAHGGNLVSPYNILPRLSTYGISDDGLSLCTDVGTSHAAPLISQYAQRLFDLYPNSDPNLIKGLICHFSDKRNIHEGLKDDVTKYVGFGEPNIKNSISATTNNATFIFEGKLDQDNYQFISFHVPSTLAAENINTKLKIKITITYDPSVNTSNIVEYSNSRISAKLIKPTSNNFKPIDISGDEKYSLPWNPIMQFEKTFSNSYLTGLWDLRLRLYTRGNLDLNYMQDYAVIIEIIDLKKYTNVYENILSEFANIYRRIKLKFTA